MKKIAISLLLVSVMVCTGCSGLMHGVSRIERPQKDTPIAKIEGDDYVPCDDSAEKAEAVAAGLKKELREIGGDVEVYASEDEYKVAQEKKAAQAKDAAKEVAAALAEESFTPVRQTITVMSTATGSKENGNYVESKPIPNAVVRVDGVPRYTDRQGQIFVTLNKEYAELYIEKTTETESYNPYIEIMDVTGEEKIVHLKQASDDIDIYAVNLYIDSNPVNLVNSNYDIYCDALGIYVADIEFKANVKADRYKLLLDSKEIYSSSQNKIYDIEFNKSMMNQTFYAQIEYNGVESKIVELKLSVVEPQVEDEETTDINNINPFDGEMSGGVFGGFNLDIAKLFKINKILKDNRKDLALKLSWDPRKGTLSLTAGFAFSDYISKDKGGPDEKSNEEKLKEAHDEIKKYKESEKPLNEERDKAQERLNKTQRELRDAEAAKDKDLARVLRLREEKEQVESKIDALNEKKEKASRKITDARNRANYQLDNAQKELKQKEKKLSDIITKKQNRQMAKDDFDAQIAAIPGLIKEVKEGFKQNEQGFIWGFEIMLVLEWNLRENKVSKFALSIDGNFGYKWNGTFFVGYVPMFYTIKVQAGLQFRLDIQNEKNGWIDFRRFWEYILVTGKVGAEGEVGAGLNGFLSVSFFAGFDYSLSGYLFATGFLKNKDRLEFFGTEFEWQVGVRAKIFLLLDFEFSGGQVFKKRPATVNEIHNGGRDPIESGAKTGKVTLTNLDRNNSLTGDSYEGSKPQIAEVGDVLVSTWIEQESVNGILQTVLKYSVCENDEWSKPQAVLKEGNDFYHDLYIDGKDLHVTWQKIKDPKYTELDDMCRNSEVYYSAFHPETKEFGSAEQLTDDHELDAAPKFAIKENVSDPLTIVWQKNSNHDIMGLTGINSVVYSSQVGPEWQEKEILQSTDRYISFLDSAYKNGELTCVFVLDEDNDLATADRKLYAAKKQGMNRMRGLGEIVNNPQFENIDGSNTLFVHSDGEIVFSDDCMDFQSFGMEKDLVNDTFRVRNTPDELIVCYHKLGEEQSQIFASVYNKETASWQYDISVAGSDGQLSNQDMIILDNKKMLFVYNDVRDDVCEVKLAVKERKADFEIVSVFYDLDTEAGEEFELTIGIKNTGDQDLNQFTIHAFGNTDSVIIGENLRIGKTIFMKVKRRFAISDNSFATILVESNRVTKEHVLETKYADISIDGISEYHNERQSFRLSLINDCMYDVSATIEVYRNGEIFDSFEVNLQAYTKTDKSVLYEEVVNGDFIYFVVKSEWKDKYDCDNEISFKIDGMREIKSTHENPHENLLKKAKLFLR